MCTALQCKASCFLAIHGKGEKRTLSDGCKIAGAFKFLRVVLIVDFQHLPEQHGSKFVLAVVAAGAVADQVANLTIMIFKFNGVAFVVSHDGVALRSVETDVANAVFYVVFMPTLCNGRSDVHALEIIQTEGGIIIFR